MRNSYDDIDYIMLGIKGITATILVGIMGYLIGTKVDNLKTKEGTMKPVETIQETTEETQLVDNLNKKDIQLGEEKTFKPNEHYICVRMPLNLKENDDENKKTEATISNIPEGYEIYTISSYTKKKGYGSTTGGYDIWFVNNKTVKVKATYSEQYKNNGYYTFGKVVEKEKQLIK